MPRYFTEDVLAEYDRLNETSLPDVGVVHTGKVTQGPGGVPVVTWEPFGTFPIAIHPVSAGNQLRYGGGSAERIALWDVTFPGGAGVGIQHRVTAIISARGAVPASQKVVFVVGMADPRTNETQYIVTAEERGRPPVAL